MRLPKADFFIDKIFFIVNISLVLKVMDMEKEDNLEEKSLEWLIEFLEVNQKLSLPEELRQRALKQIFQYLLQGIPPTRKDYYEIKNKALKKLIDSGDSHLIFRVIREIDLPAEKRIQQIKKLLEKELIWTYLLLRDTPLPLNLQEMALDRIHSTIEPEHITPLASEIIQEILGDKWIILSKKIENEINHFADLSVRPFVGTTPSHWFFRTVNEITVFRDARWFVFDREERLINQQKIITGALLVLQFGEDLSERVILFKDTTTPDFKGYAYMADPRANTVEEAIAYGYQLDPEKFKGFFVEK